MKTKTSRTSSPSLRALLALPFAALIPLACGGSSSSPPGAPPASQFASSFAHAACDNLAGCCQKSGLAFNASNCVVAAQGEAQAQLINPATAAGATYNPSAASACLSEIEAAVTACNNGTPSNTGPGNGSVATDCNNVYVGTKAPGQPCTSQYDCAPGPSGSTVSCLTWSSSTNGGTSSGQMCQVQLVGTVGASCNSNSANGPPASTYANCYAAGLSCNNGTCRKPRAPIGASCFLDTDCVTTAWCSSQTCAAKLSAGASCQTFSLACGTGLYCNQTSATCVAQLATGSACQTGTECAGGDCSSGKCVASSIASPQICGG